METLANWQNMLTLSRKKKKKKAETPPVYAKSGILYCFDGKEKLEVNCKDFVYAMGQNAQYKRRNCTFPHNRDWVDLEYGNLIICYEINGERIKFGIPYVHEPASAGENINKYARIFLESSNP